MNREINNFDKICGCESNSVLMNHILVTTKMYIYKTKFTEFPSLHFPILLTKLKKEYEMEKYTASIDGLLEKHEAKWKILKPIFENIL